MASNYYYSDKKSDLLRRQRGVGFEEIIEYIEEGHLLGVRPHPNQAKHPGQYVYDVDINGYAYTVPFDIKRNGHHLKTLYPNRVATKKYFGDNV